MTSPADQRQYQVRFDWGADGVKRIASDADVIVWVDVLGSPAESAVEAWPAGVAVVAGSLRNRRAVADWVLARQELKRDRFSVAVIAAGERSSDADLRFAVEDMLGAGAIVDALADTGIDYSSPEAAAACAAFTGLRNAVGHLVSASGSGKALGRRGLADEVATAAHIDASSVVTVLRE